MAIGVRLAAWLASLLVVTFILWPALLGTNTVGLVSVLGVAQKSRLLLTLFYCLLLFLALDFVVSISIFSLAGIKKMPFRLGRWSRFFLGGGLWVAQERGTSVVSLTVPQADRFGWLVLAATLVCVVFADAVNVVVQLASGMSIAPPVKVESFSQLKFLLLEHAVVVPIIETIMHVGTIVGIHKVVRNTAWVIVLVGLAWGALHAFVNHPAQLPSAALLFGVMTRVYLVSRNCVGIFNSSVRVFIVHSLNNAISMSLAVLMQWVN